ncbi:MAG: DUF1801 domain-containing protein [Chitinophagaceae bacterium]|nr:DUF1801 domain-containing protein [Chitinophagaceae bacterium]
MAKTDYKTIDEYIASRDADEQKVLQKIRETIQKVVPDAQEVISYQVPAFKYHGFIFYFSAYTNHYSLSCPPPWTVFDEFKKELSPFEMSKSTIQFPKAKPFPYDLLSKMSKFRAEENIELEKKKTKTKKKG